MLTKVLDWSKRDIAHQVGRADIILSKNLAKYLIIEVKRPGTLWRGRRTLEAALEQAWGYADEQKVARIAVSGGRFFYAVDIEHGTRKDKVLLDLDQPTPPAGLWWLSVHGIYRPMLLKKVDVSGWKPQWSDLSGLAAKWLFQLL